MLALFGLVFLILVGGYMLLAGAALIYGYLVFSGRFSLFGLVMFAVGAVVLYAAYVHSPITVTVTTV